MLADGNPLAVPRTSAVFVVFLGFVVSVELDCGLLLLEKVDFEGRQLANINIKPTNVMNFIFILYFFVHYAYFVIVIVS